ncbi:hypothetical protein BB560_003296, partial [Smittium megazygosporum]
MFAKFIFKGILFLVSVMAIVRAQCQKQSELDSCINDTNIQKGVTCLGSTDYSCLCRFSVRLLKCYDDFCSGDSSSETGRLVAVSQSNSDCTNAKKYEVIKERYSSLAGPSQTSEETSSTTDATTSSGTSETEQASIIERAKSSSDS